MEIEGNWPSYVLLLLLSCLLPLLCFGLYLMVGWAKGMPRGAFLFIAFFPLISMFPIPPPQFQNIEKAKQEQKKNKQTPGDPPDDEASPRIETHIK